MNVHLLSRGPFLVIVELRFFEFSGYRQVEIFGCGWGALVGKPAFQCAVATSLSGIRPGAMHVSVAAAPKAPGLNVFKSTFAACAQIHLIAQCVGERVRRIRFRPFRTRSAISNAMVNLAAFAAAQILCPSLVRWTRRVIRIVRIPILNDSRIDVAIKIFFDCLSMLEQRAEPTSRQGLIIASFPIRRIRVSWHIRKLVYGRYLLCGSTRAVSRIARSTA